MSRLARSGLISINKFESGRIAGLKTMSDRSPTSFSVMREFLRLEAAGGILLVNAAAAALVWANSPASSSYFGLLGILVAVAIGAFSIAKPLLLWINDGLMAIFFLLTRVNAGGADARLGEAPQALGQSLANRI